MLDKNTTIWKGTYRGAKARLIALTSKNGISCFILETYTGTDYLGGKYWVTAFKISNYQIEFDLIKALFSSKLKGV